MTTTNEMLEREVEQIPAGEGTSLHVFHSQNTLEEVFVAAKTVEKLGYVPELRILTSRNEPSAIELFVKDVPSLIRKLRASLAATDRRQS